MQVIEPKVPFFGSRAGSIFSFLIKLVLWYILMGWTDGIASRYYWLMLLPVMSAATSLGLAGLVARRRPGRRRVSLACFVSFRRQYYLPPDQWPRD